MRHKIIAVTGIFLISFSIFGNDGFNYSRSLTGVSDTWHRIILPDDLFMNAGNALHDLRIFGVTPQKDTVEVPYLLKVKKGKAESKMVNFKTINNTSRSGKQFITFSLDKKDLLNEIHLFLGNTNFDWKITLQGSHDQKEWFEILKDYRILSIDTDQTKYSFTALHFREVDYKFLRVFFPVTEVILNRAALINQKITEPNFQDYDGFSVSEEIDKAYRLTLLDIGLNQAVPVSYLKIPVKDKIDFYRRISIEYLMDSTETQKGWIYNYRPAYVGVINSIEDPEFSFGSVTTQKLRVKIMNHDNAPLKLGEAEVKGYQHEIIARFTEKADYALFYGNPNIRKPSYDIVQFEDKIPTTLKLLTVAEEQKIGPEEKPVKPLMNSKIWLWGILVLIIAVLGWFTLGMIKK